MSLGQAERRRLAARMVCAGFERTTPTPFIEQLIDDGLGAVVLFGRNVQTPRQVLELNAALKAWAGRPLLCCVDQEGGRVARCREGFSNLPSARDMGAAGPMRCREVGELTGRELRAVGFDLNFAPVLDVDTNPANPVIADRSFGRDSATVAACAAAYIDGLQQHVAGCGKHFPGHGDTHQDSHHDLPTLTHDLARLREVELPPFAAAARAGLAAMMSAHIVFPALDDRPATMSRRVLDLLRQDLNFTGPIISDDLLMKAVHGRYAWPEIIVGAATAGCDLLCIGHTEEAPREAIDVLASELPDGRLIDANERLDKLCQSFARPADAAADLSCLGSAGGDSARAADPTETWRR